MRMRKILCSTSLAFDSAHVKYGVWTGPKSLINLNLNISLKVYCLLFTLKHAKHCSCMYYLLYLYMRKNRSLIVRRFSVFAKTQNPTFATAIQLHPHWYVAVPSLWSKADVACSDWVIKVMIDNSILVFISSKNLHQKYGICLDRSF